MSRMPRGDAGASRVNVHGWRRLRWGWALAVMATVAAASLPPAEEFTVTRAGVTFHVRVQSPPPERLAPHPRLLLFFAGDRQSSLPDGRLGEPGRIFLEHGHRVASFDLPAHGERAGPLANGLPGLAALVAAGGEPFETFVADGRAVIDECLRRGLVGPDGLCAAGVSRGGYCALRLAAADARISGVAALAPVTDWRFLEEFAALKEQPRVAALALANFADPLAGRPLYVAIGNHDWRVGTEACAQFVQAVAAAERAQKIPASRLRFLVVDDSAGHALASRWRTEGVAYLLEPTVAPR